MLSEPIYKGATRPAMKFGIPLVPMVLLFGAGMLAMVWGGTLFSWWVVPAVLLVVGPTAAWMRITTRTDDQRLRQVFLATKLRLANKNRRLWRARSYTPTEYRGTSHAWYR